MEKIAHLENGKYYHVYNCGIDGIDLFRSQEDYERFLNLYEKFINPIAETYAWVLMKNHFHVLVKIKQNIVYKHSNEYGLYDKNKFNEIKWETVELDHSTIASSVSNADRSDDSVKFEGKETCQRPTKENLTALISKLTPTPHLHFSHMFNAYAKYFNIKYNRHGTLFERQFKRKQIDNVRYFKTVVVYIHQNPVHHGFCENLLDYGWSSYLSCISIKPTGLKREEVIGWFDTVGNFKTIHDKKIIKEDIDKFLEL